MSDAGAWPSTGLPVGGGGDYSDGGRGLYVSGADQNAWEKYGFDFRLLMVPIRWVRHQFPVQDASVVRKKKDGSSLSWIYAYCLGSPSDKDPADVWEVSDGIIQCSQIIIPGTNVPLHRCDAIKGGKTLRMYSAVIVNWTSETFQVLRRPANQWRQLIETLNRIAAQRTERGEVVDCREYDWTARCEKGNSSDFPYRNIMTPAVEKHTMEDVLHMLGEKDALGKSENAERYSEAKKYVNPVVTEDEIRDMIGTNRVVQAAPTGNILGDEQTVPGAATPDLDDDLFADVLSQALDEQGPPAEPMGQL